MKQIITSGLIILAFIAGLWPPDPSQAGETIFLAGSQDTEKVPQMKWLVLIYTEAFRRVGVEMTYVIYPLARLEAIADSGKIDGEIQRPGAYQADHPNLIRLEESPASVRYCAYAVRPGIALDGWTSLRGTSLRVEYRLGASRSETELQALVPPGRLSVIGTTWQGLMKLIKGRTDLFVDLEHNVANTMKQLRREKTDTSAIYQAGLMQETPMYAYLHRKHATLVPRVSAELKKMKTDGSIERYREIALEEN